MKHRAWILPVAAVLASFGTAAAQTTSTHTITGPNGKTASRTITRNKGSIQSSVTGPNGKSATRSTTRGGGTASATVTGPKGKSVTRQRVLTRP